MSSIQWILLFSVVALPGIGLSVYYLKIIGEQRKELTLLKYGKEALKEQIRSLTKEVNRMHLVPEAVYIRRQFNRVEQENEYLRDSSDKLARQYNRIFKKHWELKKDHSEKEYILQNLYEAHKARVMDIKQLRFEVQHLERYKRRYRIAMQLLKKSNKALIYLCQKL